MGDIRRYGEMTFGGTLGVEGDAQQARALRSGVEREGRVVRCVERAPGGG